MEKHRNADGTYNGVAVMAEMTGLGEIEVRWVFQRIKQLIRVEGKTRAEAVAMVKAESVDRPWEKILWT